MLTAILAIAALAAQDGADAYRACADITDNFARLACFDKAAARDTVLIARRENAQGAARNMPASSQQAAVAAGAATAATVTPTAAELAEARRRAEEAERRAKEAEAALAEAEKRAEEYAPIPDQFSAAVTKIDFSVRGHLLIRLDTGDLWVQLESDKPINQRQADRIKQVEVSKGFMGNWRMKLLPLDQIIRVKPAT